MDQAAETSTSPDRAKLAFAGLYEIDEAKLREEARGSSSVTDPRQRKTRSHTDTL